jgi:AmiR/NasT family two-component response regulator
MSGSDVYVIWSNPLFQEMIRLLLSGSSLDVVGSSSDHTLAKNEIERLSPDIVIIETTEANTSSSEETITFLQSGSRVIRLNLADNDLSIYRRERRTVRNIDDLLGVLMNDSASSAQGDELV